MTEPQLAAFLAISEHGSFNKAAAALFLTQPAVSNRINQLEKELGVTLLNRHRAITQVTLTEAGEAFLPHAQALMAQYQTIRREMSRFQEKSAVAIGFARSMMDGEHLAYFEIMQHIAPRLGIAVTPKPLMMPGEQRNQLLCGDVDLLFTDVSAAAWQNGGIGRRKLFEGKVYACLNARHPLAQRQRITLADLAEETFVWLSDDTFFREQVRSYLPHEPKEQCYAALIDALMSLSPSSGVILSHMKRKVADHLVHIPVETELVQQVGLVWQKSRVTPVMNQLIDEISSLPASVWRT